MEVIMKRKVALLLSILLLFSYSISSAQVFRDPSLSLTNNGLEITLLTEPQREASFYEAIYQRPIAEEYFIYDSPAMIDGRKVEREELLNTSGYPVMELLYEASEDAYMDFAINGRTIAGELIMVEAYSNNRWIEKAYQKDRGEGVKFQVRLNTAEYSDEEGRIRFRIRPKLATNGSNGIFWITDTQYYTRMINKDQGYYRAMANYGVSLYNNQKSDM